MWGGGGGCKGEGGPCSVGLAFTQSRETTQNTTHNTKHNNTQQLLKQQDLLAAGVIDPAKVTRNGLQNSCSIAGIMLSTQAVMVEKTRPGDAPGGYNPQGMPAGMTI